MAGYNDTRDLIINALMGRPSGTEIQPEKHQAYALNMLDYVRSVELVSSSTLVGLAEESTIPVQPNKGKVCYIAGVGQDRTVTFSNFIDNNGNPISITTGEMEGVFVILLWNMEHWVAYTFNTNIISSAESANFYYGYNIRKTYESVAAMNADSVNPIGTDGRLIKIGELVTVVNSTTPAENGYYSYEGSENGWTLQSGFSFEVVQTTGTDVNKAMSQKAVTDELALKIEKTSVEQTTGTDINKIMSQNISTLLLGGAVRNDLYLSDKKSYRVQQAGLPWFILDAYIDYTPVEGKYYVFSLFSKTEAGDFYFALYERDIQTDEVIQQISYFPKTFGTKLFNDVYLYTRGKTKVLVNWGVTPTTIPWSMTVTQADGMQLNPKIFRPCVLNDATLVQENLDEFEEYVNNWIDVNQLKIEVVGDNLHNPDTDTLGYSLQPDGSFSVNPAINTSDFITVEPLTEYKCNVSMWRVNCYDSAGIIILSVNGEVTTITTPENTAKIRMIYASIYPPNAVCFGKSDTDYNHPFSIKIFYMGTELITKYSDILAVLNEKIVYKPAANLHNPDTDTLGYALQPDGSMSPNPTINTSDFMTVEPLTEYKCNVSMWRVNCYDSAGIIILSVSEDDTTITTPENTAKIRMIYRSINPPNAVCFGKSSDNIITDFGVFPYDKYGRRIALFPNLVDRDNTHVLTIETADKILYTGSSSIESYYAPDFKAWVNKLQDFIDYMLVPYGWGGAGANEIAARLIADTPSPSANGVRPSEIKPTLVFIGQTLNSEDLISEEFDTNYIQSNENLLTAAVSRTGAFPIIGTAYRTQSRPWIENSLKKLADRWGAWFIPFGTYCTGMIRNDKFAGFYGSGHPAIRTHEAYTLPLLSYIERFPRPKQTLLIFEARNQSATVSELVYTNSMERAVLFRTIQVGEKALNNDYQNMYDRLNESGYTTGKNNISQYMQLLRKSNTQFGNIVLVEAIIPTVNPNSVLLEYDADNVDSIYIFDILSKTFVLLNSNWIINNQYIEFDRIKILFIGTDIVMRDIKFTINGGKDKPVQQLNRIMPVNTGLSLIESEGFTDATVSNWNIGTNTRFNMTTRFGDAKFNDMPIYLGESKDALILTDSLIRQFDITNESFGYKTLRIWTCSRLYPKIYNPDAYAAWTGTDENPYTDENWYGANKYDYDDMSIIVKYLGGSYSNQCKSINIQKVGLFWNLGYVDVILPITREGTYELIISRKTFNNAYEMQICDVSMELLD